AQNTVGAGSDTLSGFENLTGSTHDDTLTGDANNNVIDGGLGADQMAGGSGNDVYYVDNAGDVVTENADVHIGFPTPIDIVYGIDEVRTTLASYSLAANVENLTGLLNTGQLLTGNNLSNTITAGTGNDYLDGQGGADTLIGGLG